MPVHEALDRARFVAAVVVDVHVRVGVETLDHEPDEPLEGRLLLVGRRRPDVEVARLTIDLLDDPEEVFEADFCGPRIRLDVEEQVPRRRFREGAETAARVRRIGRNQLEDPLARQPFMQLEERLLVKPGQLRASDPLDGLVWLEDGESRKGRYASSR